jgi:MFS family permease
MARRRLVLAAIIGVALARSLFWVTVTEVPNPIDEIHHLGYIDSLASGRGIPIVGVDHLPRDILELMRESPTFGSRRLPLDPARPEEWGPTGYQYEGVQPPLYYVAMVPAYLAGRGWGVLGALYAVRIVSALLALVTIPITWSLARRLFPDHPPVWVFSALLLAVMQGFNSNPASVTNDSLLLPLAAGSVLVFVRSVSSPTWRNAIGCGLLIGLAMLVKLNAVALVPILGIAVLLLPRNSDRRSLWWRIGWGSTAIAVAGGVASLWFLWNLSAYGTLSGGSEAAQEMLAPLQPTYPFNLNGVLTHLGQSQSGFWQFQRFSPLGPGEYGRIFIAAALLALGGAALLAARGRSVECRRLGFLASCWPVAFLTMLAIVYLAYTGTIVGRHTYLTLAPLLVLIAGGIVLGFGRLGSVVVAVVIALALWREQSELRSYLRPVFLEHVPVEGVAPVWEQPSNAGWVPTSGVRISSDCPAAAIGLGFRDAPPGQLTAVHATGRQDLELIDEGEGMSIYSPDRSLPKEFAIVFPVSLEMGAAPGRSGIVRFAEEGGSQVPMSHIQCRHPDWEQVRFSQRFDPLHIDGITYGRARWWASLWAAGGILFALAVAAAQLRGWLHDRRGRLGAS